MIRIYKNISPENWPQLITRSTNNNQDVTFIVKEIIEQVKTNGDDALKQFTLEYNNVHLTSLKVTDEEIEIAIKQVDENLKQAIQVAQKNITTFHQSQVIEEPLVETMKGITCWRKNVAIDSVGLYIPGGTAPLFSTILMLGIPAKIAGCKDIVLCTPCNDKGIINPVILYTAKVLGITSIFKVGGAQAIAAMAYGTDSIKRVNKIFGPGNQFVTKAKELVQQNGVAIDVPAGPSELLIIADENADAEFIAADLLSQAEHGEDSQVVLLSTCETLAEKVNDFLQEQLQQLPRADIAKQTLNNSLNIVCSSITECIALSNLYAPEHLILNIDNAKIYLDEIRNAGSVFIGKYACESAGDYASGTNHTLPTNGYAKNYSGVSVDSFLKKITFQHISKEGLKSIGNTVELMAEAEQLMAHKNAVTVRLKQIENEQ
jgi:histidinol dehydrogenase